MVRDDSNQNNEDFNAVYEENLTNFRLEENSEMLRILKAGQISRDTFEAATFKDFRAGKFRVEAYGENEDGERVNLVLSDESESGIKRVFFGTSERHWITKLLLLDALGVVSQGRISIPLIRYILVDIDDIFVGKNRMKVDDVEELLKSQARIAAKVMNFRYNLGFSGGLFHLKGSSREEIEGDDLLLEYKNHFWWFPHMFAHQQPHTINSTETLIDLMKLNKKFATDHELKVDNRYSVSPHHSGVYPIHEQLYEAWRSVWNISVTSTEEYPHLRPANLRRGFQFEGISVLPRQTCGLFTKNLYYAEYPNGGPDTLEKSIRGGDLFQTIAFNLISIFMTHMPNYSFDRLAVYTFERVVNHLNCWTNFELRTERPQTLAKIYFDVYPEEKSPLWTNPCIDQRHLDISPPEEVNICDRMPDFLVIGPQKTGTTALYSFLKMHPNIRSNRNSEKTFEEIQFFSNDKYYAKGVDWYANFFPPAMPINDSSRKIYLFEKSATYFDSESSPVRAAKLLKNNDPKIVAILISPSLRAYSWYQHLRAKLDPAANKYDFHEVITADEGTAEKSLLQLKKRCLLPGKYAEHLERWLQFFKVQQVHLIDGEMLKYDPVSVMNALQKTLDVEPFFDYSNRLKYDRKKGFYCLVNENGRKKCLGKGKGRQYPPMKPQSEAFLKEYFKPHNEALERLLNKLGYDLPDWLKEDLKEDSGNNATKNVTEDHV